MKPLLGIHVCILYIYSYNLHWFLYIAIAIWKGSDYAYNYKLKQYGSNENTNFVSHPTKKVCNSHTEKIDWVVRKLFCDNYMYVATLVFDQVAS